MLAAKLRKVLALSFPRERGLLAVPLPHGTAPSRIVPAPAGVARHVGEERGADGGRPRASGDSSYVERSLHSLRRSSPRGRRVLLTVPDRSELFSVGSRRFLG
ncbi:hypothetical protein GCM10010360_21730 [Streptomyces nogalater]